MPHISAKKIKTENLSKLYSELVSALEKSTRKSKTKIFLNDLLTRTEKIMLAKRFAVVYLLSKGVPNSYIYETLHMSPATIARMSLKYENERYSNLLRSISRRNKDIWRTLEKILRAGLPPIAGRGRWKFLYKK